MAKSYLRSWRAWHSRLKVMGLASQPSAEQMFGYQSARKARRAVDDKVVGARERLFGIGHDGVLHRRGNDAIGLHGIIAQIDNGLTASL